jgi:hypothetical protein
MQAHGLRNFGNASFLKLADRPGIGLAGADTHKAVQEKRRPRWRQIADVFV